MSKRIVPITMPKWGIEMQQGTVTGWHVALGARAGRGDHLLDVETEKIVNSVEAPASGTLRLILAAAGATENVGALLGVLADESVSDGELQDFVRGFIPADASFEPAQAAAPGPAVTAAAAPPAAPQTDIPSDADARVSPIARRIAERLGIDLALVKGTGRGGRISKEDVEAFAAARACAAPASGASPPATRAGPDSEPSTRGQAVSARTRLTSMRSAIARRLVESYQSIPHYRTAVDVSCRALLARCRPGSAGPAGVSLNSLFLRAVALALRRHPSLNSHLVGDEILSFAGADLCVAVATDGGLVAPVVRAADSKTAADIDVEVKALAARARSGTLVREDLSGGTFTVSNLGKFGIDRFDAIINPPQVGILAIAAVSDRVVAMGGAPAVEPTATLTLSADHRVVDGAEAARFLRSLEELIHAPESL